MARAFKQQSVAALQFPFAYTFHSGSKLVSIQGHVLTRATALKIVRLFENILAEPNYYRLKPPPGRPRRLVAVIPINYIVRRENDRKCVLR